MGGAIKRLVTILFVVAVVGGVGFAKNKQGKFKPAGRVIEIKHELVIVGKVAKPTVMFQVVRGKIHFKGIPLKHDFVKKIVEPTLKDEF